MRIPVVVIVGRPNVGKSTLFNRLIGRRDAIVDNVSGVTRDRNYGEVEWNGKLFRIIDTGGYVPDSEELFETAIREQVGIAIGESDIILFVVDAREGVTPSDKEIANMLRPAGKKCFLIANKIDNLEQENLKSEFYELGLGDPISVSALIGRASGDLLDILTDGFPDSEAVPDPRLRIAIVGRPNVGKSSLTNALLGFERSIVTPIPGTTRDSVDSILKYHGEEIVLVDTAGLRKKARVKESIEFFSSIRTLKAVERADVVILLLDASVGFDKQDQKILDHAVQSRKATILAVNKWDLIEKDTNTARKFEVALRDQLGSVDYLPIMFISALTKQRIYKLIEHSRELLAEKRKKISTSELNDTLLPEIEKTPPHSTGTGKEVKIKYITQAEGEIPVFLFFCNYPKEIQESYKRFLEKMIRRHFGYFGVPLTLAFKQK